LIHLCHYGVVRSLFGAIVVLCLVGSVCAQDLPATPRFEVASVKPNTTNDPPSSRFPLGPGDAFLPGTLFSAANQPLINYIRFAFGRSQGELLRLPSWVYDERFDIQGRATGEPTKEDMRLMVRTLLAQRFKMAWHIEPHDEPVLELIMTKSGELGPQLIRHGADQPCGQNADATGDATFDAIPCGSAGLVSASSPGRARIAGRAEPIARLAGVLSNNRFAGVDRVVIDRTRLAGSFDFAVEWAVPVDPPDVSRSTDDTGPPIDVALRRQLGLTLRPARASIAVLVVDHVERPSGN
jgi:uncharacterized protein (TIGR03435 family)